MEKLNLNMTKEEYRAAYKKNGFCCLPKEALTSEQVDSAVLSVSEVRDGHFDTGTPPSSHPVYDPNNLCKINDAHLASNAFYNLLTKSQLGTQIAGVTNSSFVQVWATQLLIKPPGSGTEGHVGWHQDRQYWEYWQGETGLFTAWIALSEVDEKSGPMQFVVNSHRWGFLNKGDFFASDQQALKNDIKGVVNQEWFENEHGYPPTSTAASSSSTAAAKADDTQQHAADDDDGSDVGDLDSFLDGIEDMLNEDEPNP